LAGGGQGALRVERIPILRDNYAWLLRCEATGTVAVVDPGEAAPVEQALGALGWPLHQVLITHHHADHVGGALDLKARHGARMVGPAADAARIEGLDVGLRDGDTWRVGDVIAQVLAVPAHTLGHIAFHFAEAQALFCGDTLFLMGCGRLFEGSPAQLHAALARLCALPGPTAIFCAHEYTLGNARWARGLLPDDPALAARAAQVEALRAQGQPTVPGRLDQERATNLFLRVDEARVAAALGLSAHDPVAVTAALRAHKDQA
jgi:hydroxyacylglutathione hydrolase